MLATLREISAPGPAPPKPMAIPTPPSAVAEPAQEVVAATSVEQHSKSEGIRLRNGSSEGGRSRISEDSTEDEMDEDAVLLRRPSVA